jgi:hypothetical protein
MTTTAFPIRGARYFLALDGLVIGEVTEPEWGAAIAREHVVGVSYEDMTFKVGSAMSKEFYAWLESTLKLDEAGPVKNGTVLATDATGTIVDVLELVGLRIDGIGLSPGTHASIRLHLQAKAAERIGTKTCARLDVPASTTSSWDDAEVSLRLGESKLGGAGNGSSYELRGTSAELPTLSMTLSDEQVDVASWLQEVARKAASDVSGELRLVARDRASPLLVLHFKPLEVQRAKDAARVDVRVKDLVVHWGEVLLRDDARWPQPLPSLTCE